MLLSTVSVLVVAQSSSEIPEGLMNNPVYSTTLSENRAVYEITWKNMVERDRPQMTNNTIQERCDLHAR